MPLRDRDRTRPRRLERLGIIRLGYKAKTAGGKEYPKQADHFILRDAPDLFDVYGATLCAPCLAADNYSVALYRYSKDGEAEDVCEYHLKEAKKALKSKIGKVEDLPPTGRELDIIFPFSDIERNYDAAYTVWAGGVLVCMGDGDLVNYATPHRVVIEKDKDGNPVTKVYNAPGDTLVSNGVAAIDFKWNGEEFSEGAHVPCPGAEANLYPHCAACRVSGILKVMMSRSDLFRFGYYQISTGSGRNYDRILGTLEAIRGDTYDPVTGEKIIGTRPVSGIKFKLRLVEEPTMYFDKGQRKKTTKWFLQLEPEADLVRRLYRRQAEALLGEPESRPQLEPGDGDEWDDFEADPDAPPPFAEDGGPATMTVDAETGEILSDNGNPASTDNPFTVEAAKMVKTAKGTPLGELDADKLQWIIDNPERANQDQTAAAKILLDAMDDAAVQTEQKELL